MHEVKVALKRLRMRQVLAHKHWSQWWALPPELRMMGYYLVLRRVYGFGAKEALEHMRIMAGAIGAKFDLMSAMKEAIHAEA